MIEVEFNLANLSEYLSSPLIYSGSFYLFILPEQSFFLSNMDKEHSDQLLSMTPDALDRATEFRFAGDPNTSYNVFLSTIPSIGGTYVQIIPQNQLMQPSIFSTRYVLILLIVMLLGVLVFFGGAYNLIHKPLHKLILGFKALGEDNDFHMRVASSESPDFSYLYNAFNKMAEQLYKLIYQDYYHGMLLQKANLKQLQAQINPHFLYNSYFMLYRMIKSEQHEESKIVAKELGTYFQYITRNDADAVTLLDEFTHAKIYSNIQSVRFGNRIRVEFAELPGNFARFEVPKLVLQPIVENAFNYGLENKVSDGLLKVGFTDRTTSLVITVEDNGESLTDEALAEIQGKFAVSGIDGMQGEITGLVNIYRRLQIFFKRDDVLSVSRSPLGGMSVQVFIYEPESEVAGDVPIADR
jgi:two-component system sensor histidine kinase YesM